MERRAFLRIFGLATVAIASGASALSLPEKMQEIALAEGVPCDYDRLLSQIRLKLSEHAA